MELCKQIYQFDLLNRQEALSIISEMLSLISKE